MITAAAAGSTILGIEDAETHPNMVQTIVMASYIVLGFGFFVSLAIILAYLVKILIYGSSTGKFLHACWIIIGPICYTANVLLKLNSLEGYFSLFTFYWLRVLFALG